MGGLGCAHHNSLTHKQINMHIRHKRSSSSSADDEQAGKRRSTTLSCKPTFAGNVALFRGTAVGEEVVARLPSSVTAVNMERCSIEPGTISALLLLPRITALSFSLYFEKPASTTAVKARSELSLIGFSTTLTSLDCDFLQMTEEEVADISRCSSLRHFGMKYRIVTPPMVQALLRMPSLTSLAVNTLDNAGAKAVANSSLTSLEVARCHGMTQEGFEALASAKQLKKLVIGGGYTQHNVYEASLLAKSTSLQHLVVFNGCARFAALEQLEASASLITVSTLPESALPPTLERRLRQNKHNLVYKTLVSLPTLRKIPVVLLRLVVEFVV